MNIIGLNKGWLWQISIPLFIKDVIDSLKLKIDDVFGYWFDFGDDWWHQINVVSIKSRPSTGEYPKISDHQQSRWLMN